MRPRSSVGDMGILGFCPPQGKNIIQSTHRAAAVKIFLPVTAGRAGGFILPGERLAVQELALLETNDPSAYVIVAQLPLLRSFITYASEAAEQGAFFFSHRL